MESSRDNGRWGTGYDAELCDKQHRFVRISVSMRSRAPAGMSKIVVVCGVRSVFAAGFRFQKGSRLCVDQLPWRTARDELIYLTPLSIKRLSSRAYCFRV